MFPHPRRSCSSHTHAEAFLTFPVVIGTGKRLFGTGAVPRTLRLVSSRTTGKGVVVSVYRPAGSLQTGSFALDP